MSRISKGDSFQITHSGYKLDGQKFKCTRTDAKGWMGIQERIIGFEIDGYRGEKVAHGIPESWCRKLGGSEKPWKRKPRYDAEANSRGCYATAIEALRRKHEGRGE